MSKRSYVFPSLKQSAAASSSTAPRAGENRSRQNTGGGGLSPIVETRESKAQLKKPGIQHTKRARADSDSDADDSEESQEVGSLVRQRAEIANSQNLAVAEHSDEAEEDADEGDDVSELEAQLEAEDEVQRRATESIRKKRLPELDFVLAIAHKRARELLRNSDEDDDALRCVLATWLQEIQDRFEQFEKQAAKFDEYESALLQSQRMHQKYRKMIAGYLKQERQMKRDLSDAIVQNELKKKGKREAQRTAALLAALSSSSTTSG